MTPDRAPALTFGSAGLSQAGCQSVLTPPGRQRPLSWLTALGRLSALSAVH